MIVHPDFLGHFKTERLIQITGDKSSPLAAIALWSHCQMNRRWKFPDMTPAQLASVCRWGDRQPACHVAMCRAGFVDKLTPKGFAAHQWGEHNRQYIQKWEAGTKGGRPTKEENANELPPNEKPTDNRPITERSVEETILSQSSLAETIPVQTSQAASPSSTFTADTGMGSGSVVAGVGLGGLDGLVSGIASRSRVLPFTPPTIEQVENTLRMSFAGAERYAKSFHKTMTEQGWRDKEQKPLTCWQAMAKKYASSAALKARK